VRYCGSSSRTIQYRYLIQVTGARSAATAPSGPAGPGRAGTGWTGACRARLSDVGDETEHADESYKTLSGRVSPFSRVTAHLAQV